MVINFSCVVSLLCLFMFLIGRGDCCDYFLTFTLITLFLYVDYLYAFLISLLHFYRLYIVATLTYFTFLMYFVLLVRFYSVKALIKGSILLQFN